MDISNDELPMRLRFSRITNCEVTSPSYMTKTKKNIYSNLSQKSWKLEIGSRKGPRIVIQCSTTCRPVLPFRELRQGDHWTKSDLVSAIGSIGTEAGLHMAGAYGRKKTKPILQSLSNEVLMN